MKPQAHATLSPSYAHARARFREATIDVPHGALGVVDDLTIDWAFTGNPDAADLFVLSSGLHGVEGYGGSAAQLALLAETDDTPTLWLHALNPWGMAHGRRVNERNVDLNRNFLAPGEAYSGADPHYASLAHLLNPETPPGLDAFWIRTAGYLARHGWKSLKNAVVSGQYDYDKGLFFGGRELEAGPSVLLPFLDAQLGGRRRVVHVDLHSGIGARGGRTLLLEGGSSEAQVARVKAAFGPEVKTWDREDPAAYDIRGGLTRELARRFPGVRYDGLTCEFGTSNNLAVLQALREENRLHHWGVVSPDHPVKRVLRETFSPSESAWQATLAPHARAVRAASRSLLALD